MKKTLNIVVAMILVSLTALLGACGDNVSQAQAKKMASDAATAAAQSEADRADAKLMTAKAEIRKFATETARQGGYSAAANCNVLPLGIDGLSAFKNFRSSAPSDYREACTKEVSVMNQERKDRAIAAVNVEKRRVAKVAAKKARAEQVARAKAEKAAEAKRLAARPVKPTVRSAAKVANHN